MNWYGTIYNDFKVGTTTDDYLDGREGNDTIFGGAGKDWVIGWHGNDELHGGTDDDIVADGWGDDKLYGDSGNDFLQSGEGTDQLNGGNGNDNLDAGTGMDVLDGGQGQDWLWGGGDVDLMWGGADADTFYYGSRYESGVGPGDGGFLDFGKRDLIFDFDWTQDKISLSYLDAKESTPLTNDSFAFVYQNAFTAEGQVRYHFEGGSTIVQVNTVGTGGAEMEINLGSAGHLFAFNFAL